MPEREADPAEATALRSTSTDGFGIVPEGFVPKSFSRLLAEKVAAARLLLGADVDVASGSVIRAVLELTALEDARTWAALGTLYDDAYVVYAAGDALSRLGQELGVPRPYQAARGAVTVILLTDLPGGRTELALPRGARLLTAGGHHVALDQAVTLTAASREREVPVVAFFPGREHNLDPARPTQRIDRWNPADPALRELFEAEAEAGAPLTQVLHAEALSGGEVQVSDARYRQILLAVPRSIWTADAISLAVSLVPGVRQVQVFDGRGGLDLNQSIFGNFGFIERVFASGRDLGNPYYVTVLVVPTPAAIWDGPDGLHAQVLAVIEDLRPVSIFPDVVQAQEVSVGVDAELVVRGIPMPGGGPATVNASRAAAELRGRLHERLRRYVDGLPLGEPVRVAEATWALMSEPGVVDVRDVHLVRFPPEIGVQLPAGERLQHLDAGTNLALPADQVPVYLDRDDLQLLRIG